MPQRSSDRACTAAVVRSCALPYPSDEFSEPDPASATGRRLVAPDGIVEQKILDRMGPGASLDDAFENADGFSAVSPVIFEMPIPVRPSSVPEDGGDILAVYDVATGERVPMRVGVPADAARHGGPDTIVMAWPRVRFEYGHTYVARIAVRTAFSHRRGRAPCHRHDPAVRRTDLVVARRPCPGRHRPVG
ncbi:MAG: hypothetical protein V9E94_02350 [Microthrixaceae bacterium]